MIDNDADLPCNDSDNPRFDDILDRHIGRRALLGGSTAAGLAGAVGLFAAPAAAAQSYARPLYTSDAAAERPRREHGGRGELKKTK